jgi:hypothetical protein
MKKKKLNFKMKKLVIILSLLFISCGQNGQNKTQEQKLNYNYKQGKMKKTYFADFNFRGDFEIIFNGISLIKNKDSGVYMGLEYLNPYIEKSGKQTITLILKPVLSGKIPPNEIKDYYIDIVYTDNGEPAPIHKVMRCLFPSADKPVDSLIYTWTFDADVPFEINTLVDAKDLSKENPDNLLTEVLDQYKNVHNLINSGNVNDFMNLYKKSREREMISMYYDENKQKEYLIQIREHISAGKNHMLPLGEYKINISPNGKIVELEDINGKSLLVAENGEDISRYGLQLYRSIKTGKLEVY